MAVKSLQSFSQLKELVVEAEIPIIVDFWASWCGPCEMMNPIIEQLSDDFAGRMAFAKVNIDDHPEIAEAARIEEIPTMILFKNGKEISRVIGAYSHGTLTKTLLQHFES